jgi:hypothetical protein
MGSAHPAMLPDDYAADLAVIWVSILAKYHAPSSPENASRHLLEFIDGTDLISHESMTLD